jgi:hypothetical protein
VAVADGQAVCLLLSDMNVLVQRRPFHADTEDGDAGGEQASEQDGVEGDAAVEVVALQEPREQPAVRQRRRQLPVCVYTDARRSVQNKYGQQGRCWHGEVEHVSHARGQSIHASFEDVDGGDRTRGDVSDQHGVGKVFGRLDLALRNPGSVMSGIGAVDY